MVINLYNVTVTVKASCCLLVNNFKLYKITVKAAAAAAAATAAGGAAADRRTRSQAIQVSSCIY